MAWRGGSHRRVVATVLFTDIVGSTEVAASVGDARWRTLLSTYRGGVRRELRACRGREVDAAGDGFFALFDVPADALRCASRIRKFATDLGLDVRSGIHTGEIELDAGRATGIGVHIAARIQAAAAPGTILASSTTRELATGSGFGFGPSEERELRGIPGTWQISEIIDAPAEAVGGSRPRRAANRILASTGGAVAVFVVVAVGVVAAGGVIVLRGQTAAISPSPATATPAPVETTATPSIATVASPTSVSPSEPSSAGSGSASPTEPSGSADASQVPERIADGVYGPGRYVLAAVPGQPDVTLTDDWHGYSGDNFELLSVNVRKGDTMTFAAATTVPTDACGTRTSPLVGDPATAYLEWLRRNPALRVGPGVLRGTDQDASTAVDLEILAAAACPGNPATVSIVPLNVSPPGITLKTGAPVRLLVHSLGNRVLVVAVQAPTQAEFDRFLPQADAVLESIHFESQ